MGKEKTVIIVEHKIDHIVDFVDRVVLFNNQGAIIADGHKEQIFSQYKEELIEYGIWYPGVWDEYITQSQKKKEKSLSQGNQFTQSNNTPLIKLSDFMGYRGKEVKISTPNVTVGSGEWIGIVGENGAGKSTFLLALMQLIKTTGTYHLKNNSIEEIDHLSEHLAYVFQNPEFQFVTHSVYEEIAHTLKVHRYEEEEIQKKVQDLLTFFELTSRKEQHPYQLSMGQKRRLSVASAVVREQEILLLDEPTFGQDAKNTFAILEKIEEWRRKGTTILMVTHDMEIIRYFSTRVWEIADGKLAADVDSTEYISRTKSVFNELGKENEREKAAARGGLACN